MPVGIYMVNAEAMITGAAGAEAEFKLGIVGIVASADLAAAGVSLGALFIADTVDFPLEVCGGLTFFPCAGTEVMEKLAAAEDEIVQHCHQRKQIDGQGIIISKASEEVGEGRKYAQEEVKGINKSQPLHLDGYAEKEHNLGVRKECGEREEHGKIDIHRIYGGRYASDKIEQKAVYNGENNAGEEI